MSGVSKNGDTKPSMGASSNGSTTSVQPSSTGRRRPLPLIADKLIQPPTRGNVFRGIVGINFGSSSPTNGSN